MSYRWCTLIVSLLLYSSACGQTTIGLLQHNPGSLDAGYVLFAPLGSTSTYLIDKCGRQVKTWPSQYKPGQACYLLADGSLLRAANVNNTTFTAGGKGGLIEKIAPNGQVTWSYSISSTAYCQHHDIKPLPNGNVLAVVWEAKSNAEALAQGRNPALTTTTLWSEKVIEIQPQGSTGGTVVWEWHVWDHLVQDFDANKPNYGSIAVAPEKINLNFNASANANLGADWIHLNAIDYNESLDQILLSSHGFDEIWVIDHSTTTAQAASHTGGLSNKGGDLLYRWGNPQAYAQGTAADQKFFGQHHAHWIDSNLPYGQHIMVFNNGNGRTGGNYSTIEIILPPWNGTSYGTSMPYGPSDRAWMYNANNTQNLYAQNISGAQQLANGNVLYCNGPAGELVEVDASGQTLWKYVNPVSATGIMTQGATATANLTFRCSFYAQNDPGIMNLTLNAVGPIESNNGLTSACVIDLSTATTATDLNNLRVFPNPGQAAVWVACNSPMAQGALLEVYDAMGRCLYRQSVANLHQPITLDVSGFAKGVYTVMVSQASNRTVQSLLID